MNKNSKSADVISIGNAQRQSAGNDVGVPRPVKELFVAMAHDVCSRVGSCSEDLELSFVLAVRFKFALELKAFLDEMKKRNLGGGTDFSRFEANTSWEESEEFSSLWDSVEISSSDGADDFKPLKMTGSGDVDEAGIGTLTVQAAPALLRLVKEGAPLQELHEFCGKWHIRQVKVSGQNIDIPAARRSNVIGGCRFSSFNPS